MILFSYNKIVMFKQHGKNKPYNTILVNKQDEITLKKGITELLIGGSCLSLKLHTLDQVFTMTLRCVTMTQKYDEPSANR